jgi:hypothetical protein
MTSSEHVNASCSAKKNIQASCQGVKGTGFEDKNRITTILGNLFQKELFSAKMLDPVTSAVEAELELCRAGCTHLHRATCTPQSELRNCGCCYIAW